MLDDHWHDEVSNEVVVFDENETWTIETLACKKVLGYMWIFKAKYCSNATLERCKARLVVLGNSQVKGSDYSKPFSHVAKMAMVCCFLQVSVYWDLEVHHMDVHNVFTHGDLDEEVYRMPPGF